MSEEKKIELLDEELDDINGGTLTWCGTTVSSSQTGESYTRVKKTSECASFMATNCRGMSDAQTLQALLAGGYIC